MAELIVWVAASLAAAGLITCFVRIYRWFSPRTEKIMEIGLPILVAVVWALAIVSLLLI